MISIPTKRRPGKTARWHVWFTLNLQALCSRPKKQLSSGAETRKSSKKPGTIAESPKFVRESVKERNMGLLLRSHVGSVTRSESDFDPKSRSSLQIQRLEGCRVAATLVFC